MYMGGIFNINLWSSYSDKKFYEKKKINDLWTHYHSIAFPTKPIPFELGKEKIS
jgi:hypothetical protein